MKKRVALLTGGKSSEREVSLSSGGEVLAHIDREAYEVTVYDPAADLERLAREASRLDVAFLALHGPLGEDGAIQGFCRLLGLPFTGSDILASALAIDKAAAKRCYRQAGLPVADDWVVCGAANRGREQEVAARAFAHLGTPVVVKPVTQGSSVGLTLAGTEAELAAALETAGRLDPLIMLEKYLEGPEFTVGVLGDAVLTALPPVAVIPGEGHAFFDYAAKYTPGQAREICPAEIPREQADELGRLALEAHRQLGCRGLSRTDFILAGGRFNLLETNTLPGFTANSLMPRAARAYGLSFTSLISYLIELALNPEEPLERHRK